MVEAAACAGVRVSDVGGRQEGEFGFEPRAIGRCRRILGRGELDDES